MMKALQDPMTPAPMYDSMRPSGGSGSRSDRPSVASDLPACRDVERFSSPRFDAPIDLDAHVRGLPEGACCKGMFFSDLITILERRGPNALVRLGVRTEILQRRYVGFSDYPYRDFIELIVASTRVLYNGLSTGEALRRLGQGAYATLLDSLAGRVVFGVLGHDVESVLMTGPKAYGMALNFGKVTTEAVGPKRIVARFSKMPALLETYQVGIVEGTLSRCGAKPDVRVDMHSLAEATFDIRWS